MSGNRQKFIFCCNAGHLLKQTKNSYIMQGLELSFDFRLASSKRKYTKANRECLTGPRREEIVLDKTQGRSQNRNVCGERELGLGGWEEDTMATAMSSKRWTVKQLCQIKREERTREN